MAAPTPKTIPSRYSILPVTFAFAAVGATPIDITWLPGDILLVTNTHATDAKTFTIVSKPKAKRANYTVTAFSLTAGQFAVCPRFGPQDEEVLSVVGETTDIKMARLSTMTQPA